MIRAAVVIGVLTGIVAGAVAGSRPLTTQTVRLTPPVLGAGAVEHGKGGAPGPVKAPAGARGGAAKSAALAPFWISVCGATALVLSGIFWLALGAGLKAVFRHFCPDSRKPPDHGG